MLHRVAFVAIASLLAMTPGLSRAAPIIVANSDFEDPVIQGPPSDNGATYTAPPQWTLSGTGGVWDIQDYPQLNTSNTYFNPYSDGQVGWLSVGPQPGSESSFTQVLTGVTLQADTIYSLFADVGHPGPDSGSSPAGYITSFAIQLLAGTNVVGQFLSAGGPVAELDTFGFTFATSGTNPFLGEELSIRLTSSGAQTVFDNVTLDASPVPEPATLTMCGIFGLSAAGAGYLKKRRKNAVA